jgi:hypothetical protein
MKKTSGLILKLKFFTSFFKTINFSSELNGDDLGKDPSLLEAVSEMQEDQVGEDEVENNPEIQEVENEFT